MMADFNSDDLVKSITDGAINSIVAQIIHSSFTPLISVIVKTVRGKNNIFKAKSFAYIL